MPLHYSHHKNAKIETGCDTGRRPQQGESKPPKFPAGRDVVTTGRSADRHATAWHIRVNGARPQTETQVCTTNSPNIRTSIKRSILNLPATISSFTCLPLNGFTYYWTLSSKSFSTFPHGTCSLSVSWSYLVLDGVYHRLRAALPSNPTLRRYPRSKPTTVATGLAPSMGNGPIQDWTWTNRLASS